jgi:hypothetical protein
MKTFCYITTDQTIMAYLFYPCSRLVIVAFFENYIYKIFYIFVTCTFISLLILFKLDHFVCTICPSFVKWPQWTLPKLYFLFHLSSENHLKKYNGKKSCLIDLPCNLRFFFNTSNWYNIHVFSFIKWFFIHMFLDNWVKVIRSRKIQLSCILLKKNFLCAHYKNTNRFFAMFTASVHTPILNIVT